jgi:hypothetical protein
MYTIISAIKKNTKELNFHNENNEVGDRFVFCDLNLIPNSKLYSIVRVFNNINNETDKSDYIELHSHITDSLWVFIGKEIDLTGLKVSVEIDGNIKIVDSPASIYLPANVKHKYMPIKGSGYYINILISDGKQYNELTY